jgi:hypothetical protein
MCLEPWLIGYTTRKGKAENQLSPQVEAAHENAGADDKMRKT